MARFLPMVVGLLLSVFSMPVCAADRLEGTWIHFLRGWQPETEENVDWEDVAAVYVIHACRNGDFQLVHATFLRKGSQVMSDAAAPVVVYSGRWRNERGRLRVRYRFDFSDLLILPMGQSPDKSIKEADIRKEGSSLVFEGNMYLPCSYCISEATFDFRCPHLKRPAVR